MLHEGLTTGQAAKYISRHPKTLPAMDRRAYFPLGELRVGGATGCNRTWTATWEERRGSRDARCAIAACNTEKVSPEQEMVQDLMAITHCFSSRLDGLRNYRRALKEALKVILAHRIALDPTEKQKEYFRQACGTARLVGHLA